MPDDAPDTHGEVPPCRSAQRDVRATRPLVLAALMVVFGGSYWLTFAFMQSIPAAEELGSVQAEFDLWVVLMGAVIAFSVTGAIVATNWLVGLSRLFRPNDPRRIPVAMIARWVVSVLVLMVTLFASLFLTSSAQVGETIHEELGEQTRLLTLLAGVGALPGMIGFLMIRSVAAHDEHWYEPPACRVTLVVRLRQELQRLLAMFAAFLTMIVVATGMRRQALLAYDPELPIPVEQVVLYGLVFAITLGALYGVSKAAIELRVERLIDEFVPPPDPLDDSFSASIARRNELTKVMGAGTGTRRTFESTVAITAPLLTALIGSALS